jgi:hypothetical protein
MTAVETLRFLEDASGLLGDEDRAKLVAHVGEFPEAGVLIAGTGGSPKASMGARRARKVRWSSSNLSLSLQADARFPACDVRKE